MQFCSRWLKSPRQILNGRKKHLSSPSSLSLWKPDYVTRSKSDGPHKKRVAIIGAGPCGLVAFILLNKFGLRPTLFECLSEQDARTIPPRAHFINNRTMEIFRQLGGGLEDQVLGNCPPLEEWRKFLYCEGALGGSVLGCVDHFPHHHRYGRRDCGRHAGGGMDGHSPTGVSHVSQSKLQPLLLDMAKDVASDPSEQMLYGHRLKQMRILGGEGVRLQFACHGSEIVSEFDFVVAADGANSTVRKHCDIATQGSAVLQNLMSVHFSSEDLGRKLKEAGRSAMLYFIFNADVVSVLVAHDLRAGQFVAQLPFFPPHQTPEDFPALRCRDLVCASVGGPKDCAIKIESVRPWKMDVQVASRFHHPPGETEEAADYPRVFLVGDAAHRFPPAGGLGMNTGIQDAHNLAWKVAAVASGRSKAALLRSYDHERRSTALHNAALATQNWREATAVSAAVGLNADAAAMLQSGLSSVPKASTALSSFGQSLMAHMTKGLHDTVHDVARNASFVLPTSLKRSLLKPLMSPDRTLRLLYPHEDLGFVYPSADREPTRREVLSRPGEGAHFVQRIQVGGRLPHAHFLAGEALGDWISGVASQRLGNISSLDVLNELFETEASVHCAVFATVIGSTNDSKCAPVASAAFARQMSHLLDAAAALTPAPVVLVTSENDGRILAEKGCSWRCRHAVASAQWHAMVMADARLRSNGIGIHVIVIRPDGHVAWTGDYLNDFFKQDEKEIIIY